MNDAVLGDAHDLYELRASKFEAAARCEVVRVASDPERIEPQAAG